MPLDIDGIIIATDQVASEHYQQTKLHFGADGTVIQVANAAGARFPVEPGDDNPLILLASQLSAVTNSTNVRSTITGLGKYVDLQIIIEILSAGAGTGVLRLWIQDSCNGGTNFDDMVASNSFTFGATVTNQVFTVSGRIATSKVQGSRTTQQELGPGQARQGPWGDRIQVVEQVSGVSGSPTGVTYKITAVGKR